jgi:hypothetical protein
MPACRCVVWRVCGAMPDSTPLGERPPRPTLERLQTMLRKGAALRIPGRELAVLEDLARSALSWLETAKAALPRRQSTRSTAKVPHLFPLALLVRPPVTPPPLHTTASYSWPRAIDPDSGVGCRALCCFVVWGIPSVVWVCRVVWARAPPWTPWRVPHLAC